VSYLTLTLKLLGAESVTLRPQARDASGIDAVVGWGSKGNTRIAVEFARRHRIPYWRAEDGFLRSVRLGVEGEAPLSIVMDDCGIYYDARQPSRLERLIADAEPEPATLARARRVIDRIVAGQLSKYNASPPGPVDLGPSGRRRRVGARRRSLFRPSARPISRSLTADRR
jgi:capsular polysaccharide export protein